MHSADIILAAVAVLMAKHLVADFMLQTSYQAANKGRYGHIAGVTHAISHALLTPVLFLVLPPSSLGLGVTLVCVEFVWHYHQDWLKEKITHTLGYTPADTGFWWALGIDQFVHAMTYLAMVYVLLRY